MDVDANKGEDKKQTEALLSATSSRSASIDADEEIEGDNEDGDEEDSESYRAPLAKKAKKGKGICHHWNSARVPTKIKSFV